MPSPGDCAKFPGLSRPSGRLQRADCAAFLRNSALSSLPERLGVQRQAGLHRRARARLATDVYDPSEHHRPFSHSGHTQPGASLSLGFERRSVKATPVIRDLQEHLNGAHIQPNGRLACAAVAPDVGHRLLGDPEQRSARAVGKMRRIAGDLQPGYHPGLSQLLNKERKGGVKPQVVQN